MGKKGTASAGAAERERIGAALVTTRGGPRAPPLVSLRWNAGSPGRRGCATPVATFNAGLTPQAAEQNLGLVIVRELLAASAAGRWPAREAVAAVDR